MIIQDNRKEAKLVELSEVAVEHLFEHEGAKYIRGESTTVGISCLKLSGFDRIILFGSQTLVRKLNAKLVIDY